MDGSPPIFNSQVNQHYNSQQPPPPQTNSHSFTQTPQFDFQSNPQQYPFNPQYCPTLFNPQFFSGQPQFPFHQPIQPTNLEPTTTQKNCDQQSERNPNWTKQEDEVLCKAWVRVSENPITGTDQTQPNLWENILDEFKIVLGTSTDRPSKSLSNRWSILQRELNKYSACVHKVDSAPTSGFNLKNTIEAYNQTFFRIHKHQFKYFGCWLILKDCAKWFKYTKEQAEKQRIIKHRKRASLNLDVDATEKSSNPSTPTTLVSATASINLDNDDSSFSQGSHELQRPIGRKQAKSKRSNKNSDGMNLFAEQFDNMRKSQIEIVEKEMIMARERDEWRFQIKQDQERQRRETKLEQERMRIEAKYKQEQKKMDKELMMTDPNSLPTKEGKAWLVSQQKEIWARMQGGVEDHSSGSEV